MVTLRAIIEAIDGPIALNRCVARRGACPLQRQCSVHRVWQRIQDHLLDELERTTIASLVPPRAAS
jgi:DNA-binding IscR family transcriptional regulator